MNNINLKNKQDPTLKEMQTNANTIMPVRRVVQSDVSVMPSIDRIVTDAMITLSNEMVYYRTKTSSGAKLSKDEAKILKDHISCICQLSKEARDAAKANDYSNLSNEELMALAESLVNKKAE